MFVCMLFFFLFALSTCGLGSLRHTVVCAEARLAGEGAGIIGTEKYRTDYHDTVYTFLYIMIIKNNHDVKKKSD